MRSLFFALFLVSSCVAAPTIKYGSVAKLDFPTVSDKIRGGWAGQTIGCTYGGPTEFKYKGVPIDEDFSPVWYDEYIYDTFTLNPGLYDDVYMDLTFLEVMGHNGLNTPPVKFAEAFAHADYLLWHANQAARYNILHDILPPDSGHWKNNPHANDIDFQIESDFIGMLCPGMPNAALRICDGIGHIMNYGDGFYGGAYLSVLYSLAFVCNDIPTILNEALNAIPQQSRYHQCISDVISLHSKFPDDWRACWQEIELTYGKGSNCPDGVFKDLNINATINSAYVVMGLLYGEGDFERTMDIAMRCGQDSDCNPASAAGILGVIIGYDSIPDKWKLPLEKVADINFPYTSLSLNKVYDQNLDLLKQMVVLEGGGVEDDVCSIVLQRPETLPFEESFSGIAPTERRPLNINIADETVFDFEGCGVVVTGQLKATGDKASQTVGKGEEDYVARMEAFIDGQKVGDIDLPYSYVTRKYDLFHTYELSNEGVHTLMLKWTNPDRRFCVNARDMIVYNNIY